MKFPTALLAGALLVLSLPFIAQADERPDHYKGEASPTLDAAMTNLGEYNAQLAAILAKDELGPEDTAKIHELTYTLENALAKIKSEVEELEETLEDVHVASERYEVDVVKTQGSKYLDGAAKLTR
ncbi:DUF6746 family protein [Luteimonas terricola]|uniref:Uncharacterized protein n=1 Tax=Luteimonas terricola TaxID=645597 RepID=A0ABQ2EM21_9GAMM|nr:DUF6746 family protein [Luteimonas terricola]GGK12699.1 hypothetical protein GCM10011394_22460 [Luteimonas terricola]